MVVWNDLGWKGVYLLMERPILVLDGFNCFVRNLVVNESITASGDLVGGTLGFLRMMVNLINQFKPTKVYICWEQGGASPRRKHIYPEYKANRAKTGKDAFKKDGKINALADKENKSRQLLLLANILNCLPICQLYLPEVEADDIAGWLVKNKLKTINATKILVSSDKDFYQLLEDKTVKIFNPATKNLVNEEEVIARFGISPKNITLARAIVGDESDNIDGISGIGLKTVASRFSELKATDIDYDIDWVLERSKETINESVNSTRKSAKIPKCFQDIVLGEDIIRRNWKLMFLDNSSLSSDQIKKLDYKVDNFEPKINQLQFIKNFTANNIAITNDIDRIPTELRFLTI